MQRILSPKKSFSGKPSSVFLLTYYDSSIGGTGHSALYIPKDPSDSKSKPLTLSYNPSSRGGLAALHTAAGFITGSFPVPGFNLRHGPYKDTECNRTGPRVVKIDGVDVAAIKDEFQKIESEIDSGRSLFTIVNSPLNLAGKLVQQGYRLNIAFKDHQHTYGSMPEESPVTGEYMFPDDYELPEVPVNNCATQVERLLKSGGVPSQQGMFGEKIRLRYLTPLQLESEILAKGGKKMDPESKELPSDIRKAFDLDKSIKASGVSLPTNEFRMDPNLF